MRDAVVPLLHTCSLSLSQQELSLSKGRRWCPSVQEHLHPCRTMLECTFSPYNTPPPSLRAKPKPLAQARPVREAEDEGSRDECSEDESSREESDQSPF